MIHRAISGCLIAACLLAPAWGPAWAQTGASSQPSMPGTPSPAPAESGRFLTQAPASAWRASKLVGLDVYGSDNARIGDINEILVGRDGQAQAVVIGVGGFLGVGEKNVAVPFKALEWASEPRTGAGTGAGVANAPAIPVVPGLSAPGAGTTGPVPGARDAALAPQSGGAVPAPTAGTTGAGAAGPGDPASRFYPDHAVLRMTKADLQNAPAFRFASDRAGASGTNNGGPAGSPAPGGGATKPGSGLAGLGKARRLQSRGGWGAGALCGLGNRADIARRINFVYI